MTTCRKYWLILMERLDARQEDAAESSIERDTELSAHLSQCADCRNALAKARVLTQALDVLPMNAPKVTADFTDRLLHRWEAEKIVPSQTWPRVWDGRHRMRVGVWVGLAAAAALAIVMGISRIPQPTPKDLPGPMASIHPPLDRAVVGAGAATLSLAKETSGPVFRVGQRMFRSASFLRVPSLALPSVDLSASAPGENSESRPNPNPTPEQESKSETSDPSSNSDNSTPASSSISDSTRRVFELLRGSKS